jgi:type I restriction enzyme, S subunit
MQGKLVPQDPKDQPASELLKEIEAEKRKLIKEGKIKKQKELPPIKPKEVPYEVPVGWVWVILGNITTLITKGSTPTSYGYVFLNEGIPFIKVENVKNGSIQFTSKMQFISEDAHQFQRRSQLVENDLLFSIAGTIGETCIVKSTDLPANINQALALIRGYNSAFTPLFLINALNSIVSERIKSRARGAAMYNISLGDISEMLIPLPPLAEQKRIVAKIDELMALCDSIIEKIKQSVDKQTALFDAVLSKI